MYIVYLSLHCTKLFEWWNGERITFYYLYLCQIATQFGDFCRLLPWQNSVWFLHELGHHWIPPRCPVKWCTVFSFLIFLLLKVCFFSSTMSWWCRGLGCSGGVSVSSAAFHSSWLSSNPLPLTSICCSGSRLLGAPFDLKPEDRHCPSPSGLKTGEEKKVAWLCCCFGPG